MVVPVVHQDGAVLVTLLGLPLHPLLVHAVVVLIPLAATGAVALAIRPRWTRPYGLLVAAAALLGAVTATLAKFAGDQLEAALTISEEFRAQIADHGRFGLFTAIASWPFAVLAVATVLLERRPGATGTPTRTCAVLAAVAGVVALVLTVLAGHSGSAAVWGFLGS